MAKRVKSDTKEIERLCRDIAKEATLWEAIRDCGCNDPHWPDGCNMNLIRNHIIDDKQRIRELCGESGASRPDEYYISVPPEVNDNYMAGMRQKERVERLKQQGCRLNREKAPEYDAAQINLFDFIEGQEVGK